MHAIFGNWQVSGLVQAQTRPVTVLQGSNISARVSAKIAGTFTGSDPTQESLRSIGNDGTLLDGSVPLLSSWLLTDHQEHLWHSR